MITVKTVTSMKKKGERIVCLTAYDFISARILDEVGIDIILVGDSAANVFAGEKTTLPITMDEMLYHTRVVARAVQNALVIADMPFLSYQVSTETAVYNAGRFLQVGACGVKLEGGAPVLETVKRLVDLGIPVMGHLGLTPQSVHKFGGYKIQGVGEDARKQMIEDARSLQAAGCFSIVLEKIPRDLAEKITKEINIPTIGIGAGPHCDGQVLVLHDMLGLFEDFTPKFVKKYAILGEHIRHAVEQYRDDVKKGQFPGPEHSFD
ncbi:3-methyl-2-oxobutanoate hydroxymethyltransferase [candidate division WOR_3 bacterium SM23_42]|uniref:3-methyl-2-oxobutanoate hydroxymethyltransferase n=1 Tax=candidate division WOR_3 bacterium SM23_42 TaxID=1703779 RepID=A0A0S8FQD3_UNCW3|nr:MAG: 3-methyl-2-oxobutanoate hydroxymethyltransferase [candidate division WOR_3 bacterium SM23_42]